MESTYGRQVAFICERARAYRRADEHLLTEAVVLALGVVVETRDRNTLGHCQRLAAHAAATGASLGLPGDELRTLYRGGYLHDLGKIAIPDGVLLKTGSLTPEEFAVMKLHPVIGDALCRRLPMLQRVRPIVRWHHERLDGTGYPDGLKGDRIPLLAQLMGIADVYDAMTSARPYKAAQSPATSCEILMDEVKRGWRRRDLVEAFIDAVVTRTTAGLAA
jgi:putative two-component system response regulator